MSFTYTNSPNTSNRDRVRFLINDRTETGHRVTDEEIVYLLAQHSSVLYAAAAAADIIAGQLSASVSSKKVGDLALTLGGSDPASQYRTLAATLRRQAAVAGTGAPFSGGISVGDVDSQNLDTDRVPPNFAVGMHDNPPNTATSTSTQSVVF